MDTVEFLTELSGKPVLTIPQEIVAKLPKSGPARVIVLTGDADGTEWRKAAYEQFMREDAPEDSVLRQLFLIVCGERKTNPFTTV